MRGILKSYGALRTSKDSAAWLLLNVKGDYQYRNPDSVYVHSFVTFRTEEEALDYLARNIAQVDRADWKVYSTTEADRD